MSSGNGGGKMDGEYGRGREIWPPTNMDRSVKLQDSFPQGQIPHPAMLAILEQQDLLQQQHQQQQQQVQTEEDDTISSKPTRTTITNRNTWLDRIPALLALALLGRIRPIADVGLVVTLSIYTAALSLAAQSCQNNSQQGDDSTIMSSNSSSSIGALCIPTVPSLPPQGHVPQLVQNPMRDLSYSFGYDLWWKLGIGLGFVLPCVSLAYYSIFLYSSSAAAASASVTQVLTSTLARPLFLLCCQALSELLCKDWFLPLPIRIWIPISYQIIRIPYLALGWIALWAARSSLLPLPPCTLSSLLSSSSSSSVMSVWIFLHWVRLLTGLNLVYTVINVFGFLIPVALMRYMRAHFFTVEASSVTVHKGLEESLGLPTTTT